MDPSEMSLFLHPQSHFYSLDNESKARIQKIWEKVEFQENPRAYIVRSYLRGKDTEVLNYFLKIIVNIDSNGSLLT
jgi:hypothetical protein